MKSKGGELSTGESAIYDRQIRLWGSQAQLRIKASRVLIVGLTGVTVEISKNLVLAGCSVFVEDSRPVTDSTTNFLISLEIENSSATATALRNLNEHPEINNVNDTQNLLSNKGNTSYTAVILSLSYLELDMTRVLSLTDWAREAKVGCFVVFDKSPVYWCFTDMGAVHVVEEHTPPLKRDEKTGERKAEKRTEEHDFCTLREFVVDDKVSAGLPEKWFGPIKDGWPAKEMLLVYYLLRYLSSSVAEEDQANSGCFGGKRLKRSSFSEYVQVQVDRVHISLKNKKIATYLNDNKTRLVQSIAELMCQVTESPLDAREEPPQLCACLGALVAQEVIKYVTKRDPPLVNTITVSPGDCSAIVQKVPASLQSRIMKNDNDKPANQDVVIDDELECTGLDGACSNVEVFLE